MQANNRPASDMTERTADAPQPESPYQKLTTLIADARKQLKQVCTKAQLAVSFPQNDNIEFKHSEFKGYTSKKPGFKSGDVVSGALEADKLYAEQNIKVLWNLLANMEQVVGEIAKRDKNLRSPLLFPFAMVGLASVRVQLSSMEQGLTCFDAETKTPQVYGEDSYAVANIYLNFLAALDKSGALQTLPLGDKITNAGIGKVRCMLHIAKFTLNVGTAKQKLSKIKDIVKPGEFQAKLKETDTLETLKEHQKTLEAWKSLLDAGLEEAKKNDSTIWGPEIYYDHLSRPIKDTLLPQVIALQYTVNTRIKGYTQAAEAAKRPVQEDKKTERYGGEAKIRLKDEFSAATKQLLSFQLEVKQLKAANEAASKRIKALKEQQKISAHQAPILNKKIKAFDDHMKKATAELTGLNQCIANLKGQSVDMIGALKSVMHWSEQELKQYAKMHMQDVKKRGDNLFFSNKVSADKYVNEGTVLGSLVCARIKKLQGDIAWFNKNKRDFQAFLHQTQATHQLAEEEIRTLQAQHKTNVIELNDKEKNIETQKGVLSILEAEQQRLSQSPHAKLLASVRAFDSRTLRKQERECKASPLRADSPDDSLTLSITPSVSTSDLSLEASDESEKIESSAYSKLRVVAPVLGAVTVGTAVGALVGALYLGVKLTAIFATAVLLPWAFTGAAVALVFFGVVYGVSQCCARGRTPLRKSLFLAVPDSNSAMILSCEATEISYAATVSSCSCSSRTFSTSFLAEGSTLAGLCS